MNLYKKITSIFGQNSKVSKDKAATKYLDYGPLPKPDAEKKNKKDTNGTLIFMKNMGIFIAVILFLYICYVDYGSDSSSSTKAATSVSKKLLDPKKHEQNKKDAIDRAKDIENEAKVEEIGAESKAIKNQIVKNSASQVADIEKHDKAKQEKEQEQKVTNDELLRNQEKAKYDEEEVKFQEKKKKIQFAVDEINAENPKTLEEPHMSVKLKLNKQSNKFEQQGTKTLVPPVKKFLKYDEDYNEFVKKDSTEKLQKPLFEAKTLVNEVKENVMETINNKVVDEILKNSQAIKEAALTEIKNNKVTMLKQKDMASEKDEA